MPERETIERAREHARGGKSPSTQAGEFVREEIHQVREGKHGASSAKQAIAIGLSKARRAGVKLPTPKGRSAIRKKASQDAKAGEHPGHKVSTKRSRATAAALRREPRSSTTHLALSRNAKATAKKRTKAERSQSARKAARARKAA